MLILTGGHDFETNRFFQIFRDRGDLAFQVAEHPRAHFWLNPEIARRFDVLLLYDLWQEITDTAKTNLVTWLDQGKGLVAIHHALADYQNWPQFSRILGGKYYLEPTIVGGVEKPRSTYLHDVHFHVRLPDPGHPVTRGVQDFDIVDETYGKFEVDPTAHGLLTTDAPTSGPVIGWARTNGTARVVYLQLGHGHTAYENPNYRRLIGQAIRWTARRE